MSMLYANGNMKRFIILFTFLLGIGASLTQQTVVGFIRQQELMWVYRNCSKEQGRTKGMVCFRKKLEPMVRHKGVRIVIESLASALQGAGMVPVSSSFTCHDVAHAIGQIGALSSDAISVPLGACTDLCGAGCYHGVIEGYLARGIDVIDAIPGICATFDTGRKQAECFHGLGHGIANFMKLPIGETINRCDAAPTEDYRKECGEGVIMEYFNPTGIVFANADIPEDILRLCRSFQGVYERSCYTVSGLYEYARENNFQKAVAVCLSVPLGIGPTCIEYVGQSVFELNGRSADQAIGICMDSGKELVFSCITGVIRAIILADPRAREGFVLCDKIESSLRPSCYKILGEKLEVAHGSESRQKLCSNLPVDRQTWCRGGMNE